MVVLSFNTLLTEAGIHPTSCKLARHQTVGPQGTTPYSVWRNDPATFEFYQSIQKKPRFNRNWLASFIGTPTSETLFVGLYRVSGPERNRQSAACPVMGHSFAPNTIWVYKLSHDDRLSDFEKRLLIEWGPGALAWTQNVDAQLKQIVFRDVQEPNFPGFLEFRVRLDDLRNAYSTWQYALLSQRGVYLLAVDDGQQYVGSATAGAGFWQRWQDYLTSGHGGNVILKRENRDAREAMVCVLETARHTDTRQDILDCEYRW
jgi:hypothetical protein